MTLNAEAHPLEVVVLDGEIVMTGPRVAIAMQPEAAVETARRLFAAAERASLQTRDPLVEVTYGSACNDL